MGSFDEARKAIQDILAPELRGITVRLDSIDKRLDGMDKLFAEVDASITDVRNELRGEIHISEAHLVAAIDQAKREVLLTVQLADAEQRNAILLRKVAELEQKSPQ